MANLVQHFVWLVQSHQTNCPETRLGDDFKLEIDEGENGVDGDLLFE